MRRMKFLTTAIVGPALLLIPGVWVHAQNTTNFATPVPVEVPTGPTPRMPNGKPDFTGVWQRAYVPDMSRNGRGQQGHAEAPFAANDTPARREELRKAGNYGELPFTPAGLEDWKTYDPANGEYTASCMPFGLSRSMNGFGYRPIHTARMSSGANVANSR